MSLKSSLPKLDRPVAHLPREVESPTPRRPWVEIGQIPKQLFSGKEGPDRAFRLLAEFAKCTPSEALDAYEILLEGGCTAYGFVRVFAREVA